MITYLIHLLHFFVRNCFYLTMAVIVARHFIRFCIIHFYIFMKKKIKISTIGSECPVILIRNSIHFIDFLIKSYSGVIFCSCFKRFNNQIVENYVFIFTLPLQKNNNLSKIQCIHIFPVIIFLQIIYK